jgi:multidrug resistance efflux pump
MMAAMLVLALMAGVTQAADKKVKPVTVAGSITAVSADSITVQPGDAAKPAVTVAITDTTKIRVNGKEAKADALKTGEKVRVTLDAEGKNAVAINAGEMKGHGEGRK